ncbi:glycerophosphoryl diester phosphodiesterase membrane domain-containing protein [Streptomyces goshikiensis]|uniref:glycerophosphoryl diester phosphodiesterase membrane domain-containing protein n=1 Tax=Streptomyces goshikiensis TaxID=1942 RepID=UPI0036615F93
MNDSPGWATPGSPSDGEGTDGTQPPARPAGDQKWSAEQPPPGQWAGPGTGASDTPATPPQQPQQGAGGRSYAQTGDTRRYGAPYGGQNGTTGTGGAGGGWGAWGPPPAAKPGVIPLRPLGLGEILDGAVTTMRTHWRSVLSISLAVAVLVQVFSVLVQKYSADRLTVEPGSGARMEDISGSSVLLTLAAFFIQLLGGLLVTAMLTMIFSRAVLGRPSTVGGAWRDARGQLLRLAGLTLLLGVGAVAVFVLLILPGILAGNVGIGVLGGLVAAVLVTWLWIRLSLASPALMLEKAKIRTALSRSSKLVNGSWWRIFGVTVLTAVITALVSAIIIYPLLAVSVALFGGGLEGLADGTALNSWGALILTGVGSIIALTITMPIQSGVTVLLYIDQRIRREALDLELARAAGLENYGADATAPPTAG